MTPGDRVNPATPDDDGSACPVRRLDDWDASALRRLAGEYGTPLYVLDIERVRRNYQRFQSEIRRAIRIADDRFSGPAGASVHVRYAAKANLSPAVLETLRSAGAGVEVASAAELAAARAAGFPPETIQYTAVNPPSEDIEAVLRYWQETDGPAAVTAGARDVLDRLAERGYDGPLAVRIRPGDGVGHHDGVVTGTDRGFGIALPEAADVVAEAARRFDLVGLHTHVGSGVLNDDLSDHAAALTRVGEFARRATGDTATGGAGPTIDSNGPGADLDLDLEFVDLGGGFGVPYDPQEAPLELDQTAEALLSAVRGVDADMIVEPGRYLVADAGVLLTRVNTVRPPAPSDTAADRDDHRRPLVVGVDAGLHTLARTAMFDTSHPVRNLATTAADRPPVPTTVVGPVCSSADRLCTTRPLARANRGDLVAVGMTGAYGLELASRFHGRPLPTEVIVDSRNASAVASFDPSDARLGRHPEYGW